MQQHAGRVCESERSHFILPRPRKDTLSCPVRTTNVPQHPVSYLGDNVVKCGSCVVLFQKKQGEAHSTVNTEHTQHVSNQWLISSSNDVNLQLFESVIILCGKHNAPWILLFTLNMT